MIQGTEQQDIAIASRTKPKLVRKILLIAIASGALWLSWQWLFAGGAQASLVIPRQQVQIGTVSRGDFVRDLAVQGKVVAANAPTAASTGVEGMTIDRKAVVSAAANSTMMNGNQSSFRSMKAMML